VKKENEDTERKQLATFFDKKEADLSGRKNTSNQRTKKPSSDRKERQPKQKKVNGNHSAEIPGTPEDTASTDEVEPAKENGDSREETPEVVSGDAE
jgi:hypothetical protein